MKLPPSPSPFGAWFSMYWWWITVPATLRYRQTLLSHQLLWQSIFIKEWEGKQICKMELPVTVWKLLPAPPRASGVGAVRGVWQEQRVAFPEHTATAARMPSMATHIQARTLHTMQFWRSLMKAWSAALWLMTGIGVLPTGQLMRQSLHVCLGQPHLKKIISGYFRH